MGFFDNFFKKKSSGEVAKDRLKLLLVSDRSNCSPETMELIKNEGEAHEEGEAHHHHHHGSVDPHIWTSISGARVIAQNTCLALIFRSHKVAKNPKDLHYMQIFRSVSLENNIGEILCCEIIDCRITISNLFLTYLY